MHPAKTDGTTKVNSETGSLFEESQDEYSNLLTDEKKELLARLPPLYNNGDISLSMVALMALSIAGNTKGAEFFRELCPFEHREAYYNSTDILQASDDPVLSRLLKNMYIGDSPSTSAKINPSV